MRKLPFITLAVLAMGFTLVLSSFAKGGGGRAGAFSGSEGTSRGGLGRDFSGDNIGSDRIARGERDLSRDDSRGEFLRHEMNEGLSRDNLSGNLSRQDAEGDTFAGANQDLSRDQDRFAGADRNMRQEHGDE
jgi:hypothetical protein